MAPGPASSEAKHVFSVAHKPTDSACMCLTT